MKRTHLHHQVKGHLGQYEDDWYLIEEDDGSLYVLHDQDHVRVNGLQKSGGENRIEIDEFLKTGPAKPVARLKEILD